MGYAPPSYEELPLPTRQEFDKDPEYYWRKLEEYRNRPRLFGALELPLFIRRQIRHARR